MPNLSHVIRSFNRFELKYILTLRQAEEMKRALRPYLLIDEHGNQSGEYLLTSLYYDSPDYRCYHEKVDGVLARRKLRIRYYGELPLYADDEQVMLEIKQRYNRVTQKRRAVLPLRVALNLCDERRMPECSADDEPFIEEVVSFLWQYNLQPTSVVRYLRQALVGSEYDIGLRVTFDSQLECQVQNLSMPMRGAVIPLFPADLVIMEIKVNERIPYWLTELVAAKNLQLARVSKYCQSIEVSGCAFSMPRSLLFVE
jgi:SPX domain protein involved in polyphosphate accumulation